MDEHGLEGLLLHLLHAGEDHPGHPEKDDVVAGDHDGGRIPILQIRRLRIGPAQSRKRPQRRGEPGVQYVLVPSQVGTAALLTLGGILAADIDVAAIIAVPGRNLVAPPKLAGNAPIMDVFHPIDISLGEALGHELNGSVLHHTDGLLGQGRHLHEPLGGD